MHYVDVQMMGRWVEETEKKIKGHNGEAMKLDTINKYKGVDRPGLKRLTCVSLSSQESKNSDSPCLIP